MALAIRIPYMAESIDRVDVIKCLKKIGDSVRKDDLIFEVESEKASFEIVAETNGTILYLAKEGEVLKISQIICIVGNPYEDLSVFANEIKLEDPRKNIRNLNPILAKDLIFISYSSVDSPFALKLAGDLKRMGANIWIDKVDLKLGLPWDTQIQMALAKAERFLIVVSRASSESENVLDEIHFAIENKKKIIPVMMENCTIPMRLSRLQFISFINQYEEALNLLTSHLKIDF